MKLSVKEIALIGMMTATLEAAKLALSWLPNVELVTILVLVYTLYFGKKIFFVIPVFVLVEGLIYGIGVWWIMYLYAWPLLAVLALVFRKVQNVYFWAVLAGAFGLCFGALCSIPYFFISGPLYAFSWWISGIPYDVLHGASNFVVCLLLFRPLTNLCKTVKKTF